MLDKEKQDVVNFFRSNMRGYLALSDIQESVTSITYLFWNAKYNNKNSFYQCHDKNELNNFLMESCNENDLVWNIFSSLRGGLEDINLTNIFEYLNKFSEEKLIDIICQDYSVYSKYYSSTPETICKLAYEILEQRNSSQKVLDICSDTGNFLTYYARKHNNYHFTGIEINKRNTLISQQKMNALKVKNELITEDIFNYNFKEKFDKVFCNFPFGLRFNSVDYERINHNQDDIRFEFSSRISSSWAFINKVINSLSSSGKAVVVTNNAGLYKLPDSDYRKLLVENGFVESVISLPEKLFANTSIPVTLLVLSRNNERVKFINAEKMLSNTLKNGPINELDIAKIMIEYNSYDNTENTKFISIYDICQNNYSLLVQNYMDAEKIDIKNAKKLSDVCLNIYRGYQVSSNEVNQFSENVDGRKEYKIINITNINDGMIDKELTTIYPDHSKLDKYLLEDGDLLISSKGTLSKFAVVEIKNDENYIPSGNFTILRLDKTLINPYYLKTFFESSKGTAIINSIKSGGVLPAINLSQFKDINIPVPNIEEQLRVVNKCLAKTDEINMLKIKLNKLEENLSDIINEEF